jgi:hypothetical protein
MEDDLNLFYKWKTTSIYFVNGRPPKFFYLEDDFVFLQMEDDLISFVVGRPPHFNVGSKLNSSSIDFPRHRPILNGRLSELAGYPSLT